MQKRKRYRDGYTLVELLVVMLILAILMAVGLPLYLETMIDSERKTCRTNMQSIANAEQAYRVSSSVHQFVSFKAGDNLAATLKDLDTTPLCPTGGQYSVKLDEVAPGTFSVHCNVPAHDKSKIPGEPNGFTPGRNSR